MMELIRKFLRDNKGKEIILFLKDSNFRYCGELVDVDDSAIVLDEVKNNLMVISLDKIAEVRLKGGQE